MRSGVDLERLEQAWALVLQRGAVAQLCVTQDGEVLLDRTVGCAPDSLFWTFSASKPFIAVLVHLLADRGALRLDAPVADYWPAFGQAGKEAVTVRQVLQHRTGTAVVGSALREALTVTSWTRSVRRIERAHPQWPPGQVPAYQYLGYGFILGELVQRVTGRSVGAVMRAEVLEPLGLADTFLGLGAETWPRHVPVRFSNPAARAAQVVINLRRTREAVIPSAGVSTTARDLTRFYRMVLEGGELDGRRILSARAVLEARTPSSDGETDRFVRMPVRWSQGFQLGGPRPGGLRNPFGQTSSSRTFGHNGSGCCIGWADPDRRLAVAYLSNLVTSPALDSPHQSAVADAILAACPAPSAGTASPAV